MDVIRSAAAVVWRRAGEPEVLLARRRPRLRFFGGVHAFCGGRVDPVDERVAARAGGADHHLDVLRSALAREVLEELALDLRTGRAADPALVTRIRAEPARWEEELAPAELAVLPEPCLRLVTPSFYPRRFDTWFFLAEVAADFAPRLCPEELDDGGFDRPQAWLERWQAGEFLLAPPTVVMLRVLAAHPPAEWADALGRTGAAVADPRRLQEIRTDPAVRLLPLRTPTLPPARHTNAYLVGHRDAWLVDPATPWAEEQARLGATLDAALADGASLQGILLTHHHHDHVGAAVAMAARFELPVCAHPESAARLEGRIEVHRHLEDGAVLPFVHADGQPGRLRALFTPGHAPGHLCFYEERYRGLVAGDMVSTLSSILVDPDDGDMGEYLLSLDRLASLELQCVYPAHGPADARGRDVIADQIRHRRERADAVLGVVARGPVELEALTREVWGDVPRPMLGYARKSAVSILRLLERQGMVRLVGEVAKPV